MLFETVALSATAGGSVSGDFTIVADQIDDTLSLKAGNNIALEGDDAADSITIEAVTGGSDGHIQYNDTDEFDGSAGLVFNKVDTGTSGTSIDDPVNAGPIVTLHNTNSTLSDADFERFSAFAFSGTATTTTSFLNARIGGFHHSFGSGVNTAGRGGLFIQTFNAAASATKAALIIDSGDKNPQDMRGYVGIGAINPSLSTTDADAVARFEPARKLHIKEALPTDGDALAVHSPLRINDLKPGPGELMVWNGVPAQPLDGVQFPDAGDVYYLPKGNSGDYLGIDENGNLQWYPTQGKVESGTDIDTEVDGPYTPTSSIGDGVWPGVSYTDVSTDAGILFNAKARGSAQRKAAGTPVSPAKGVRYGVVIEKATGVNAGDVQALFVGEEVHGSIGNGIIDEWEFDFSMAFSSATGGDPANRDISVGGVFTLFNGATLASSSYPMRFFRKVGNPSAPSDPGDGKQFKDVAVVADGIKARFVVLRPDAVITNVQNKHTDGLDIKLESFSTRLNIGEEA